MRQNRGAILGTSDALTSLFFLKRKQDIPYRILEQLMGGVNGSTLQRWFNMIVDYVYTHSPVLHRSRNLSNPNNMIPLLEELHAASMRCTRFSAAFLPTLRRIMRDNPQLGKGSIQKKKNGNILVFYQYWGGEYPPTNMFPGFFLKKKHV